MIYNLLNINTNIWVGRMFTGEIIRVVVFWIVLHGAREKGTPTFGPCTCQIGLAVYRVALWADVGWMACCRSLFQGRCGGYNWRKKCDAAVVPFRRCGRQPGPRTVSWRPASLSSAVRPIGLACTTMAIPTLTPGRPESRTRLRRVAGSNFPTTWCI